MQGESSDDRRRMGRSEGQRENYGDARIWEIVEQKDSLETANEMSKEENLIEKITELSSQSSDAKCAICTDDIERKTYVSHCYHSYCYQCIVSWAAFSRICPLCRGEFSSLIYDVVPPSDFKERKLLSLENHHSSDSTRALVPIDSYRYLSSRIINRIASQPPAVTNSLPVSSQRMSTYDDPYITRTVDARRLIYLRRMEFSHFSLPFRPSTWILNSLHFQQYPLQIERIRLWLYRELLAVLPAGSDVMFVLTYITNLLPRIDINSNVFAESISFFLGNDTSKFIQELLNFSHSSYSLQGYDASAVYLNGRINFPGVLSPDACNELPP